MRFTTHWRILSSKNYSYTSSRGQFLSHDVDVKVLYFFTAMTFPIVSIWYPLPLFIFANIVPLINYLIFVECFHNSQSYLHITEQGIFFCRCCIIHWLMANLYLIFSKLRINWFYCNSKPICHMNEQAFPWNIKYTLITIFFGKKQKH